MRSKIIIKGYYGFGNLGDDVLMLVSYRLICNIFPDADIYICSNHPHNDYIHRLLGDQVVLIKDHDPIKADWIVDGGGGVYFDFSKAGLLYYCLNKVINLVGINLVKRVYKRYRQLKGVPGITAKYRAGIGIGIGTYTRSSSRYFTQLISLSDYNFLSVRDAESESHVRKMGFKYPVSLASDLAFLTQYWYGQQYDATNDKPVVGFILRDWKSTGVSVFDSIKKVGVALKEKGINVLFFSFDRTADPAYKAYFEEFTFHEWDPTEASLDEYLKKLSICSMVVTSRAHGAILSACMGVPSVCIAIEPKLDQVSQMLKNSSQLITTPMLMHDLERMILATLAAKELKVGVKQDVEMNRIKMEAVIKRFKEFVAKTKVK